MYLALWMNQEKNIFLKSYGGFMENLACVVTKGLQTNSHVGQDSQEDKPQRENSMHTNTD